MTKFDKKPDNYIVFVFIFSTLFFPFVLDAKPADKPKPIPTIKTMDDLLKLSGIKDPKERKYVEDETKQYLQDEISKHIDTGLDVVVYLQTLDHFAHGESKKANMNFAGEVFKKILENLIGSGFMTALTAAWEFDKYVWKSVQQWAEKKDMEKYKAFLLEHTKKWDQDKDLWEIERRGARQVFRLWWEDYKNALGKTKMYKDRQAYYLTFKNNCFWHFRKVTSKYKQAKTAESTLKESAILKRKAILFRLGMERENYRKASRVLKLAKQKGDMAKLVKKYWSDKAFKKKMDELAYNNSKVFIEKDTGLFKNAEQDVKLAAMSASEAKKAIKAIKESKDDKPQIPIIPIQLGAYKNFLSDYQTLTAKIFSNSLEDVVSGNSSDIIVASAVDDWYRKYAKFHQNVMFVRNYYDSSLTKYINSIDKSKVNQLKAEIKRIDDAAKDFNTALLNEKKKREQEAVNNMLSLRSQVKNLNRLAAQTVPINKNIEKEFQKERIKFREETKKLLESTPGSVIGSKSLEQLLRLNSLSYTKMEQYSTFYEKKIGLQSNFLDKLESDIPNLLKASEKLREEKKEAVDRLEESAKPFVAGWCYFATSSGRSPGTGVEIPLEARLSGEANVWPESWRTWLAKSTGKATNAEKRLFSLLQYEKRILFDMLEYETQMEDLFHDERIIHSKAQNLLAGLKALAKPYSKTVNWKELENSESYLAGLTFLRSESAKRDALFTQMISRNHTVMKLFNGSFSGYEKMLNEKTIASYRLDKFPYGAYRYYAQNSKKLVKNVELVIKHASQSGTSGAQDAAALKKAKAIMKELYSLRAVSKLLDSPVHSIVHEASGLNRSIIAFYLRTGITTDINTARKSLDSLKKFVGHADKNFADDNRIMEGYLKQVKALLATLKGGTESDANAKNRQRVVELLSMATKYTEVMELYALYKGSWRYNVKIKELKDQLNKIGQGDGPQQKKLTPDDVYDFPAGWNYHVTINGISSTSMPRYQANRIPSKNGEIEIRTQSYDPVFRNAKKVMICIFPGSRPKHPVFTTVSRKGPDFVHRLKVPFDKPYTMEVRIVTDKLLGYTPVQYPLGFQWGKMPVVKTGNVQTFRIRKRGDIIKLNCKLDEPLELKFTTGGTQSEGELHVLSLVGGALYGQKPWEEYAMFSGHWIGLTPYTRSSDASTKFVHYSTEEEENKGLRSWEFRTFINPNEQYNVFRKLGNKWQLVAYVIGMNVKTPNILKDNGINTSSNSNTDSTGTTQVVPPKPPSTKLTWGKTANTTNSGKDITEPSPRVNKTINQSNDKHDIVSSWNVKQAGDLGNRWDVIEPFGWKGVWTRRGNSNVFDALWTNQGRQEKALLTITINGNTVNVQRTQKSGSSYPGQKGTYKGVLAADRVTVTGTSSFDWAKGPFKWQATIKRGGKNIYHNTSDVIKTSGVRTEKWEVNQSNGYKGILNLQHYSEGLITGKAVWNGTLFGTVAGKISGKIIEFTISYPGGVKGFYKGTLTQGGSRIVNGSTKGNNGVSAKWDATLNSSSSSGGKREDGLPKVNIGKGWQTAQTGALNSINPKAKQWSTTGGGFMVMKGNHRFDKLWYRRTWGEKDPFYSNGESTKLPPKHSHAEVMKHAIIKLGQVTVRGPGFLALYGRIKGPGAWVKLYDSNRRRFHPQTGGAQVMYRSKAWTWKNGRWNGSWSGKWTGDVSELYANRQMGGWVPPNKIVTYDVELDQGWYNNMNVQFGSMGFGAPQEIDYELWFFPRKGGGIKWKSYSASSSD